MAVLLITYDPGKPGQDCEKILGFIKSSKSWAKLSESSYAISTEETPVSIFGQLRPFLSDQSKLFVVTLMGPCAGVRNTAVIQWLEKNIPT